MASPAAELATMTNRILDVVRQAPDCGLDHLVRSCSEFSWQDVLLEVSRLNLIGHLQVTPSSTMTAYTVRLLEQEPGELDVYF